MNVNIELPIYAIAIIGSFLQFSSVQIFISLDDYSKKVSHSHNKVLGIRLARSLSLCLWILCIICVAVGLGLYLYFIEWLVVFLLLILCIISLATVILISFVVLILQMPFLRHIGNSAV